MSQRIRSAIVLPMCGRYAFVSVVFLGQDVGMIRLRW
jgi:hypothetical protein